MATGYITHPACLQHETGEHHPEAPERISAIEDRLIADGLFDLLRHFSAPRASREQLARVHDPDLLDRLQAASPASGLVYLDPDTPIGPHSLTAAEHAAGAVVLGVEKVMGGEVENAFCAVRPPGHHAEPGRAMGFCLFNNIAVGAAHALERFGLERVAIVDFDVHHGNGTEAMFGTDERVLFCSSFQHPYYPYTELAEGRANLHCPLPAGADSAQFRAAIESRWLPALEAFRPQLLLISAGFDAHLLDELGQLRLVEEDYGWVTERLMEVARVHTEGRAVSVLEGGYHLDALGRSVAVHLRALMGIHG
jgi:acetoin utilization deacetylase AcuC-like enzyme